MTQKAKHTSNSYFKGISTRRYAHGGVFSTKTAGIFSNYQSADHLIGQPDFETKNSLLSGASLNLPGPVTISGNQLYISDSRNHRILGYHQIPSLNGATVDFMIGQGDFTLSNPKD